MGARHERLGGDIGGRHGLDGMMICSLLVDNNMNKYPS